IVPRPGVMLDLGTLAGRCDTIEDGVERLVGAPRGELVAEVEFFARAAGGVPSPLRTLVHADGRTRQELAGRLRAYHDVAIAPYWPRLRDHLAGERARAAQAILDHGVDGLFVGLGSDRLRWRPPVLEVRSAGQPIPESGPDYHLDGRGLLLAPSTFFWPDPVVFRDLTAQRPDVLVYPAPPDPAIVGFWGAPVDRGLAGLRGSSRAKVLAAAAGGATTTGLSRRAGVSMASASEHAAVLREAGLLRAERAGGAVRHSLTELGVGLLGLGRG
ncbi:MAG: helix-turn-helix domain-containing protein, partial [Actinomycetia bacterium]|nr:helix-turn-helix domain-containing protein [Actinomycetes bacterium]